MKLILVLILMLLVAVQSFSKGLILLDYQVNQEYIAKTLCENKARPKLHCKGKCQLMKQLAAEEKSSNGQEGTTAKVQFATLLFQNDIAPIATLSFGAIISNPEVYYLLKPYTAPRSAVFHPPLGC
jgi:hypothetical protein